MSATALLGSSLVLAAVAPHAFAAFTTQTVVVTPENPTSQGSTVTYTAEVCAAGDSCPDANPASVPPAGSVSFASDGTAIPGCTNVATSFTYPNPPWAQVATCVVNDIAYGRFAVTANYTSTNATASSGTLSETVADPPLAPYTFPSTSITDIGFQNTRLNGVGQLVMSATAPCSPMAYVQGNLGITTDPETGLPDENQWGLAHTNNKFNGPAGYGQWSNSGYGCDATTYLSGTPGTEAANDTPVGCNTNLVQTGCGGEPNWTNLGCTAFAAGQTATGCVKMPAQSGQSIPEYGVPSSTLIMPITCLFNDTTPSGYNPNPGTSKDDKNGPSNSPPGGSVDADGYVSHPDGNNGGSGIEGDAMACTVQAQEYAGQSSDATPEPVWTNLGAPTLLRENQPISLHGAGEISTTGSVVIPLRHSSSEIRLKYNYYLLQNGNLDTSGVTDIPYTGSILGMGGRCSGATGFAGVCDETAGTLPAPIGSLYCSNAAVWAANDSNGFKACQNDASVAVGATPAIVFDVEPAGLVQLGPVVDRIIYQPPGPYDINTFTTDKTTDTSVKISMGTQSEISRGSSNELQISESASVGIPDIFEVNVTHSNTWENSVKATSVTAGDSSDEVRVSTDVETNLPAGASPQLASVGVPPPAKLPKHKTIANYVHYPWLYDTVELALKTQVALFDLNTCANGTVPQQLTTGSQAGKYTCPGTAIFAGAGYDPFATGVGDAKVTISDLLTCIDDPTPANCIVTAPVGQVSEELTPDSAKAIVTQDPFAATALGYAPVPGGGQGGQSVDPSQVLTTVGQFQTLDAVDVNTESGGDGEFEAQSAGSSELKEWDGTSSFSTDVETSESNSVEISASGNIPIDILSLGGGVTVDYSNTSTQGSSMEMSYGQAYDSGTSQSWTAKNTYFTNDPTGEGGPVTHNFLPILDPRFDTLMFEVDQPEVTGVQGTVTKKGGETLTFFDTDLVKQTALNTGPLTVVACVYGTTTCTTEQKQSTGATLATVVTHFPASTFTYGQQYTVTVLGYAGLSAPFNFTWTKGTKPGPDLAVSQTLTPGATSGTATATITVRNHGPKMAKSVNLDDLYNANPFSIGVASSTPPSTCGFLGAAAPGVTAPVGCTIPSLKSGASWQITFNLNGASGQPVSSTVSVSDTQIEPTPADNVASGTINFT